MDTTRRWSPRSRTLAWALAISVALSVLLIAFFGIRVSMLQNENSTLTRQMREAERDLAPMRQELAQLKKDLEALVEGRLPHLRRLEYDKVIPLAEGYAKNIAFTLVKRGQEESYEYKLVVQNDSLSTVDPDLKLYLFDKTGIQVGVSRISGEAPMGLGEVRSYTRMVNTEEDATPAYFMLRLTQDRDTLADRARGG